MTQRLAVGLLIATVASVSLLFLGAMLDYTNGGMSAPLDDTFIYFQYARQLAGGHFFEYTNGAEFSTGATSIGYPIMLAGGYLVGFSDERLIGFAFALATLGLVLTTMLTYSIIRPLHGVWAGLAGGLLVVVNGWMLWGYLSMMEVWLYGTLLLLTVFFLTGASGMRRAWPAAMIAAGLLVFARPEAMLVGLAAALLGVIVIMRTRFRGRADRRHPAWALLPVLSGAAYFFLIRVGSGSFTTNGFALKSVLRDSYLSTFEKVGQMSVNFVDGVQELFGRTGSEPVAAAAFGLALLAIATGLPREWRRDEIGVATATSVLLLVGLAATAQASQDAAIHQRYLMALAPPVAILVILGLWELGNITSAPESVLVVAAGTLILLAGPSVTDWASAFGENSAEVHLQQREVGLWLRDNTPEDSLIAVNDAGAITYYSDRSVYDLVGLVTNDQARAFREGQGSVYESVERLPAEERPDYFAVFPNWFLFIVEAPQDFEQLFSARLDERRISGGEQIVVYRPRYDSFNDAMGTDLSLQIIDEVDVADLASEVEHAYLASARQSGIRLEHQTAHSRLGRGLSDELDGGRIVSRTEQFRLESEPNTQVILRGRFLFPEDHFQDEFSLTSSPYQIHVKVNGKATGAFSAIEPSVSWTEQQLIIPAALNPTGRLNVEVSVDPGWTYESFHYWLLQ